MSVTRPNYEIDIRNLKESASDGELPELPLRMGG